MPVNVTWRCRRAIMPEDIAQGIKPGLRCRIKDKIHAPGVRIEENDRTLVDGHGGEMPPDPRIFSDNPRVSIEGAAKQQIDRSQNPTAPETAYYRSASGCQRGCHFHRKTAVNRPGSAARSAEKTSCASCGGHKRLTRSRVFNRPCAMRRSTVRRSRDR